MIIQPIISKIDTTSNWKTFNPIPRSGEQCIEDLGKGLFKLKIGDGVTPWVSLKYATSLPRDLVESVNGKTGFVTLTAVDVGAQPTLPDGEEGQALFKINGGVEWKDIVIEVSHDNSLSGTGTVEDPLKLSEEVNNRLDSFATQEEVNKKQDILTAGDGIEIKDGVISNTKVSAEWGKIEGSLDNQIDLKNALDLKANKSDLIKDVQNISSIDIYNDVSELPVLNAGLNGTRYLALTNGKLPLKIYTWDNPTQTWELIDSVRGSSLYINIQTGLVYYYRSSTPYLRPVNDKAEWGKITGVIDDQTDLKNLLDSKVNKVNDKSIVYGTDVDGNQTIYSKEDFGKVDDVQLNGISIVENKVANIEPIANDISYTNSQYPNMKTLQDAMDKLLYITPTISISGGGNYEIGSSRVSTTLKWTWNKNIQSQSLNQGIGTLDPSVRTYTYNNSITSNTTFTITGTDGTTSKSASTTVQFLPKRYWGVSANTELTDAEIIALSSELSTSRKQSRVFNCSGGKYFYFAIKTSYCSGISFKVGGLAFGGMEVTTRQFTNASGYTDSYNIYRVGNLQTGSAISVEVL